MDGAGPGITAIQDAAAFASRAHRNQLRKDGRTPYVSHVFRVAFTVRHVFGCDDPVALTVALLHDTIEDTTTDYDDLAQRFGADVAACVASLTKNSALPEVEREREYDARLARADWRARLVKLADVFDNLCDSATDGGPKEKHFERCRRALALAAQDRANPDIERAMSALHRVMESARPVV